MEHHIAHSARRHIELVKAYYNKIVTSKDKLLSENNKEITELNVTVVLQSERIIELAEQLERNKQPMATK